MLDASAIYSNLSPELVTLDSERIRLRNKIYPINAAFFILIIAGGGALYWLLANRQDDTLDWYVPSFGIIAFVSFILWAFGRYYYKEQFKKLFITKIVPKIIANLGEEFSYDHEQEVSETDVRESMLFPNFNKFSGEDLIRGKIDDVTLKFGEIRLVEERGKSSGSGSNYTTIFEGIYFHASLSVTFPTSIWIVTTEFDETLKANGIRQLNIENNPMPKYRYYGQDPELAEAVLQPFVLEKIQALNQRLKTAGIAKKPLIFRFSKNQVQTALWTKYGLFEPKISKTINSREFIEKQTVLLNTLTGLLKELSLK
jgi:hypothetical protein